MHKLWNRRNSIYRSKNLNFLRHLVFSFSWGCFRCCLLLSYYVLAAELCFLCNFIEFDCIEIVCLDFVVVVFDWKQKQTIINGNSSTTLIDSLFNAFLIFMMCSITKNKVTLWVIDSCCKYNATKSKLYDITLIDPVLKTKVKNNINLSRL